jgi:hypothetical protein
MKSNPSNPSNVNLVDYEQVLAQLEATLDQQQQVSKQALDRLAALSKRETEIYQTSRPEQVPLTGGGWTLEAFMQHFATLRQIDQKFDTERDRRYAELSLERERALLIKEQADERALILARDIQHYRDEQSNNLRAQIDRERGEYVSQTQFEALDDKSEQRKREMEDKLAATSASWFREHTSLVEEWRNQHSVVVADIAALRIELVAQPEVRILERQQEGLIKERVGHIDTLVQVIVVLGIVVALLVGLAYIIFK